MPSRWTTPGSMGRGHLHGVADQRSNLPAPPPGLMTIVEASELRQRLASGSSKFDYSCQMVAETGVGYAVAKLNDAGQTLELLVTDANGRAVRYRAPAVPTSEAARG